MLHSLCAPSPGSNGLAIFGAGAAGREIAWLAQRCWGEEISITFLVDGDSLVGTRANGIPTVHIREFAQKFPRTPVLVAVGDPALREQCVRKCAAAGLGFTTLVHPRVETSRRVAVGMGTMICAGVVLTTNINIGQHVYINIGCTISHNAQIADYATLSPGVHLAGWVTVGRRAFFGTGAVVRNGSADRPVTIGENAIIGAGACVIQDVEPNTTVVGVPAMRTLP